MRDEGATSSCHRNQHIFRAELERREAGGVRVRVTCKSRDLGFSETHKRRITRDALLGLRAGGGSAEEVVLGLKSPEPETIPQRQEQTRPITRMNSALLTCKSGSF